MRRASAHRITAVIPYYGYKRDVGQPPFSVGARHAGSPTDSAVPLAAADVALMLASMVRASVHAYAAWLTAPARAGPPQGVDRVVAVELQPPGHGQIEGFFPTHVMVDNLETTAAAVEYFAGRQWPDPVVVLAPNDMCVKKARDFQVRVFVCVSVRPALR